MAEKRIGSAGRPRVEFIGVCRVCGRNTRKPQETLADRPNTVKGHDATGEVCTTCYDNPSDIPRWLHAGLTKEERESRIAQARADLDALVADRRRRGVNPMGVIFPGEEPPTRELGSAFCKRGHAYDERFRASDGRRRCPRCEKLRKEENRRALRQRSEFGLAS